jgi:hypothetical protein
MTDKERLRRIWITLEYLFAWWPYLSDEEKLEVAGRALEDTRNHEQIEQLREKVSGLGNGPVGEP